MQAHPPLATCGAILCLSRTIIIVRELVGTLDANILVVGHLRSELLIWRVCIIRQPADS